MTGWKWLRILALTLSRKKNDSILTDIHYKTIIEPQYMCWDVSELFRNRKRKT
jgi:hypothetical protein